MKRILFFISAALITAFSASCNKNGETISGDDPSGTITLNGNRNDWVKIQHGSAGYDLVWDVSFCVNPDNNLSASMLSSCYQTGPINEKTEIVSLGTGKGLASININRIPTSGWNSESAAIEGGLYILHYKITWEHEDRRVDGSPGGSAEYYYGLQIVKVQEVANYGITQYTVKYCPFTPEKGWNK